MKNIELAYRLAVVWALVLGIKACALIVHDAPIKQWEPTASIHEHDRTLTCARYRCAKHLAGTNRRMSSRGWIGCYPNKVNETLDLKTLCTRSGGVIKAVL